MGDSGYYLRDVREKKAAILDGVPDARLETWQDYGFRLTAIRADGQVMTVMQPARDENGQEFINRSASDAIRFLRGESP